MTTKRWQRVHRKIQESKCACGYDYPGPFEGLALAHYDRCRQRLEYQVETVYEPREGPVDEFPLAGSKGHASLAKRHVTVTWENGETENRELPTSRSAKSQLEKRWSLGCPIEKAIQIAFLDTIVLEPPDPGARAKRLVSKAAKATAKASVPLPLEVKP